VNSLPKTVTGQRRDCDLNPRPSAPEPSTLTTRLPSHPFSLLKQIDTVVMLPTKAGTCGLLRILKSYRASAFSGEVACEPCLSRFAISNCIYRV